MPTAREVYRMLDNESLWAAAERCRDVLAAANVPHAICGGVAVCLHGYQRNTVDLDLIVRREDAAAAKSALVEAGHVWHAREREFRTSDGAVVRFLLAGESAGKGTSVVLPDPGASANIEEIEGLPVLRLSRLIESKIAAGEGNIRRAYKDFADVVELIAIRNLNSSFARHLHPSLRKTFKDLVKRARA